MSGWKLFRNDERHQLKDTGIPSNIKQNKQYILHFNETIEHQIHENLKSNQRQPACNLLDKLKTDFSIETGQVGKLWNHIFKMLRENSEIHFQQKSSNGSEGKINTFPDTQNRACH